MSDDYLWDRSGPEDPEIRELEELLAPFRGAPTATRRPISRARRIRQILQRNVAAAAILLSAALLFRGHSPRTEPYLVSHTEGTPEIAGSECYSPLTSGLSLKPGDWVVTGPGDQISVSIADIGTVRLLPDGRLGVASADQLDETGEYGLFLDRGTLVATIFAAPRIFQVGTPAGIAVDMGCAYRATVTEDGETTLAVDMGVVQFETEDGFAYVPRDAECVATPKGGPGPPYWSDKDPAFRQASRDRDLDYLVAHAEERDSLTLWHFLLDDDRAVRTKALRALQLCGNGAEYDEDRVLDGDRVEIDAYRRSFEWSW